MTKVAVIEKLISSVRKYLNRLEDLKKIPAKEFGKDQLLEGALEHNLYRVTQSTIDLAEAVIAYKDLRRPSTFSENFDILREAKIIDADLNQKMKTMAGLRNVLAHDYENLDIKRLYLVMQNDLDDIEEFLKAIKTKLKV